MNLYGYSNELSSLDLLKGYKFLSLFCLCSYFLGYCIHVNLFLCQLWKLQFFSRYMHVCQSVGFNLCSADISA